MTTTSNQSTTTPPCDEPWRVHEEFRAGSVFARIEIHDESDGDDWRITFATSREGLDGSGALTIDDPWDLHRALSAAGLFGEILHSATMSEERLVERELHRLGITGIHQEAACWDKLDLEPDSSPVSDEEAATASPDREGFEIAGIAGCIEAINDDEMRDGYQFRFAESTWDLAVPTRCFSGKSLNALVRAAWVASIMLDIQRGDAGTRALGYRELTRQGVRTLKLGSEFPA